VGGGVSIDQGVLRILHRAEAGAELRDVRWPVAVLLASMVAETFSFVMARREFERARAGRSIAQTLADSRDPTLLLVMLEDAAALFGLVVALVGVLATYATGDGLYDGAASIVVGLALCSAGWLLGRDTMSLLVGESANEASQRKMIEIVRGHPDVCELVHQRTIHLGPDEVLAALKVRFRSGLETRALEGRINELEAALRAELPQLRRIYIEPGFDERATTGRA
jgi:divalent metal cation (Fe/Co/Zn/Cd) transporter